MYFFILDSNHETITGPFDMLSFYSYAIWIIVFIQTSSETRQKDEFWF